LLEFKQMDKKKLNDHEVAIQLNEKIFAALEKLEANSVSVSEITAYLVFINHYAQANPDHFSVASKLAEVILEHEDDFPIIEAAEEDNKFLA